VAAADPRQEPAGAGFGQGSVSERRYTVFVFMLNWKLQNGGSQAAEPQAVGQLLLILVECCVSANRITIHLLE
jgi:hypothetical protein